MTQPRSQLVLPSRTRYYHCISRCVRRAWLCGEDDYTGENFDHRKPWLLERMTLLGEVFAIRIAGDPEHSTLANDPEYSLVTRLSDGQMLFLANKFSKIKQYTRLGSRIAEVHNGSSLFTGDAGQGESNIRRWIIENDWLEAIVALPLNLFYNTGIATFVWVLTNCKPAHRHGKVQLIDATGWHRPLRKNLCKMNCEISFNRYFYKPQPMRTLEEIRADILALQAEADSLLPDFILRETKGEYVTRLRIYVDTSVIGGCHDSEFRDASLALFEWFRKGKAQMVYSEVTISELSNAPEFVRETFDGVPDENKELILMTEDAEQLADAYLGAGALGSANRADAEHIALATLAKVDTLASWNFKHMVSKQRINAYNQVNEQSGHARIVIRTPEATIHE